MMVKDNELRTEYIRIYDNIHASDELKDKVLKLEKKKRNPKPFIASAATVAAGIMIFAAVHNVPLNRNKTDDVISETVTSVSDTGNETKNTAVPPFTGDGDARTEDENSVRKSASAEKEDNKPKSTSSANNPAASSADAANSSAVYKTTEQLEREASSKANGTYEKAKASVQRKSTEEIKAHDAASPELKSPKEESYIYQSQTEEISVQEDNESGNEETAEASSGTADISARSLKTGGVALYVNTSDALNTVSQDSAAVSLYSAKIETVWEEWDNNRYFNYIGKDIISCVESVESFDYIGDDSAYFMVDEDGKPKDDSRMFEFSNGTDRVNITTSTDTSFIDSYMSGDLLKSSVNGAQVVIFESENQYKCYMAAEGIAYIIDAYTEKPDILEAILLSL